MSQLYRPDRAIRGESPPTPAPSPQPRPQIYASPPSGSRAAEAGPSRSTERGEQMQVDVEEDGGRGTSGWQPKGYRRPDARTASSSSGSIPFFPPDQLPPSPSPTGTASPSPFTSQSPALLEPLASPPPAPVSPADQVSLLRTAVNALPRQAREELMSLLLLDTPSIDLSPLYRLIHPRLQRDFLQSLPLELALHVLSFIDDHRTLARASGVSRYWHGLLERHEIWKGMCVKYGYALPDLPPSPY